MNKVGANKIDIDKIFQTFSFNGRLLLKEMQKRNISLAPIGNTNFFRACFKNHSEVFYELYTSLSSFTQGIIIDDKYFTKQLLKKHGFKVAPGEVFSYSEKEKALVYAAKIGFPVVIKPTVGSHGDHIYLDLDSAEELVEKIELYRQQNVGNGFYLVEKQHFLSESRLFIAKNGFFAAVNRIPANVTGDGKKSLRQLAEDESFRRMNPRNTCLCTIKLDDITLAYLKKKGLTLDYVPAKNEQVFLRSNSNVTTGGNCYDATDLVHPSVIKKAKEILEICNVPFIGIDYLSEDISKASEDYIICELNSSPGLSMHMMPEKGQSRDVAKAITDVIFPETAND